MAEQMIAVRKGLRWSRKPGSIQSRDELIECIDELTRFLESELGTIDRGDSLEDVSQLKPVIQRSRSLRVHRYIKAVLSLPSLFRRSRDNHGPILSKSTKCS